VIGLSFTVFGLFVLALNLEASLVTLWIQFCLRETSHPTGRHTRRNGLDEADIIHANELDEEGDETTVVRLPHMGRPRMVNVTGLLT